ncbi:MAG TPA: DUF1345 domain-containing protein [Anaerolineae bacterium]|nr:DUF1345 domain-containing protein [Anaerolineae bacterium]
MTNERWRAFYDERRRQGPGLIALAIVGILNWIVSDVLNFSALVSQLNIDMSGFKQVANMLLPEFGLFGTLFIMGVICWLFDWDRLTRVIFFIANGIATFLVANYAFDLLFSLTKRSGNRDAALLLIDAVLVWLMNLIVFTIWYWMLDRGGPDRRSTPYAGRRDWLFPQDQSSVEGWEAWKPGFTDYLYAAFAYSASFGPNDTQMLSQRFKILSMAQTMLSLMVVVMIAARAINLFTA